MERPTEQPDRINLNDKAKRESWARQLNTTHERLREAVGAVGDDPRAAEKSLRQLSQTQQGGRGTMQAALLSLGQGPLVNGESAQQSFERGQLPRHHVRGRR